MDGTDNIDELATKIFTKPPGRPNSIHLQLEEVTADIAMEEGIDNFVFNILCLITYKGMQILYGHKNILELTEREFDNICEYVMSYGYKLRIFANNTRNTPWELQRQGIPILRYQVTFDKFY